MFIGFYKFLHFCELLAIIIALGLHNSVGHTVPNSGIKTKIAGRQDFGEQQQPIYNRAHSAQYGNNNNNNNYIRQQQAHYQLANNAADNNNNQDQYYSRCPSAYTGQLPYINDCRSFLNCFQGQTHIQNCAPGTLFNAKTLQCEQANQVNCAIAARPERLRSLTHNSENDLELCPKNYNGLQAHASDCTKFISCANGIAHVQQCGPGTAYNAKSMICDFIDKVDCAAGKTDNVLSQQNIYNAAKQSTQLSQNIFCPDEMSGLFAHPFDNKRFLNCRNGGTGIQNCEPNKIYSISQQRCMDKQLLNTHDYVQYSMSEFDRYKPQSLVSCPPNTEGTHMYPYAVDKMLQCKSNGDMQIMSCPQGYRYSMSEGSCQPLQHNSINSEPIKAYSAVNLECPHQNGIEFYAHPFDPSRYIRCGNGKLSIQKCNAGRIYSDTQKQCIIDHTFHAYIAEANDMDAFTAADQLMCPKHLNGTFAHPFAANMYLRCRQGHIMLEACQSGYTYSSITQQCTAAEQQANWQHRQPKYQEQTASANNVQQIACPKLENLPTEFGFYIHPFDNQLYLTCQFERTSVRACPKGYKFQFYEGKCMPLNNRDQTYTKTSSSVAATASNVACPPLTSGQFVYPFDCTKFIRCINGESFLESCAAGQVFSLAAKDCVIEKYVPEMDRVPHNAQNQHTTAHNVKGKNNLSDSYCKSIYNALNHAHPEDCKKYIQCEHGKAVVKSCAAGTAWHSDNKLCTASNLAKCAPNHAINFNCATNDNALYAHSDCKKFISCAHGVAHVQNCPKGTAWDQNAQICDFEQNVICNSNTNTGHHIYMPVRDPQQTYKTPLAPLPSATTSTTAKNLYYAQPVNSQEDSEEIFNAHGYGSQPNPANPVRYPYPRLDDPYAIDHTNRSRDFPAYLPGQPAENLAPVNTYAPIPPSSQTNQNTPYNQAPSGPNTPVFQDSQHFQGQRPVNEPANFTPINPYAPRPSYSQAHYEPQSDNNRDLQQRPVNEAENYTPRPSYSQVNQNRAPFFHDSQDFEGQQPVDEQENFSPKNTYAPTPNQNRPHNEAPTRYSPGTQYTNRPIANRQQPLEESESFHPTNTYGSINGQRTLDEPDYFTPINNYSPKPQNSYTEVSSMQNLAASPSGYLQPPLSYLAPVNTTIQTAENPLALHYSSSYSGVAHSRGNNWNNVPDNQEVDNSTLNEALQLLLRPYITHNITEVKLPDSHIMSLVTKTATKTTTQDPRLHKTDLVDAEEDAELIAGDEQVDLAAKPIYITRKYVPSEANFHTREYHSSDDSAPEVPTNEELDTSLNFVDNSKCDFDCGNRICIKTHQICDGINHCANKKDESNCNHLTYELRLAGATEKHMGRVEVKLSDQWGYVCDNKFGLHDADVVCRELGFPLGASEVRGSSFYAPPTSKPTFLMDEVECIGNETSLRECAFKDWTVHNCEPEQVVGVACKVPLHKCPNDYWLCGSLKECIPVHFVCDNTPDCTDKSDESQEICNAPVKYRLEAGRNANEGRLEVKYRGVWGTVCDDDFGLQEAQVACKSLGYFGKPRIQLNKYGPGNGPIWLDQVACFGNESNLEQCSHSAFGQHNCNHTEDVGLFCTFGPPSRSSISSEVMATNMLEDEDIGLYASAFDKEELKQKSCGRFTDNLADEFAHPEQRVVNGTRAKRGRHPWQATIRARGVGGISSHWCGAVLITKQHLLTAAHCLVGSARDSYFVRLGDHYSSIYEGTEKDAFIEHWIIHEKFREGALMNNDIALILLKRKVTFNDYIQPICLPTKLNKLEANRQCTISGWGSIKSGVSTPSTVLRAAQIPILPDEICRQENVYGSSITSGMFCAGTMDESVDACDGDSGGPLACSDEGGETLYGIISWGQHCGYANKPGVYVRLEKYIDWIYENINLSLQHTKRSIQ